MVDAPGVVGGQSSVEADADAYPGGGQGGEAAAGEQGAVGLDGGGDPGARGGPGHGGPYGVDGRGQGGGGGEQRFAAVQDQVDPGQVVGGGVFGDPLGGAGGGGGGHGGRLAAPALVGHLVDVAVGAGEVAAAARLEHELPYRMGPVPGGPRGGHVEPGVGPGRVPGVVQPLRGGVVVRGGAGTGGRGRHGVARDRSPHRRTPSP